MWPTRRVPSGRPTTGADLHQELMMLTPEQMMAAQKANMDTLLGLTHKAFEGVEKLVELNMQLARAAMSDTADWICFMIKSWESTMALDSN